MDEKYVLTEKLSDSFFDDIHLEAADSKDEQLLQSLTDRLCAGDPNALEQLYLKLYDPIVQFISSIIRSREDASDLTQEVFVYLWENKEKFSSVRSIKGYMYSIARTQAYRFIRSRSAEKGNRSLSDYPPPEIGDFAPDDIMIADETKLLIALAMESMTAEKRQIFEMKRDEKLSYDEIAERMNMKKRTVEHHVYEITRDLKRMLYLFGFVFLANGLIN